DSVAESRERVPGLPQSRPSVLRLVRTALRRTERQQTASELERLAQRAGRAHGDLELPDRRGDVPLGAGKQPPAPSGGDRAPRMREVVRSIVQVPEHGLRAIDPAEREQGLHRLRVPPKEAQLPPPRATLEVLDLLVVRPCPLRMSIGDLDAPQHAEVLTGADARP